MSVGKESRGLRGTDQPLCVAYDVAMLDLDGVVYIGRDAVPGAAQHLAVAAARGMHLAYVTNNASRPPSAVAAHLQELGVAAASEDVVTSAQAAARLVADQVPAGASVFVIGGEGLVEALAELGLRATQSYADEPVAVVSGYGPDLRWRTVIDGAILVREGLPWVASNTDMTVPTPRGPGPGNGVLVKAVADYAGVVPTVAGKPEPPLFHETTRRVGGDRPLVVGDRLDTDIEGAQRAGYDSLLVMTGVTGAAELVAAAPDQRPDYVAATLESLSRPQPLPERGPDGWRCGRWLATVQGIELQVDRLGPAPHPAHPADGPGDQGNGGDGDRDDWWRVVAAAAWEHLDSTGSPVSTGSLLPPAAPDGAGPERG